MNEFLLQTLKICYTSIGIITITGYWPTIKDLYYHKKPSANTTSYIVWTICSVIALIYGIFILHDLSFIFVSGVGFICCSIILFLSLKFKK